MSVSQNAVVRLVALGGSGIEDADSIGWCQLVSECEDAARLVPLYQTKNGFHAFESAFICLPVTGSSNYPGLIDMASSAPWRSDPLSPAFGHLAFAVNGMSEIFAVGENGVRHVDLQSDEVVNKWSGLEDFCADLLNNFELHTGHAFVHEWQEIHGPLPVGQTLIPIRPFILGGEFSASNLGNVPIAEALDYNYDMGAQLREMEDGQKVVIEIRP